MVLEGAPTSEWPLPLAVSLETNGGMIPLALELRTWSTARSFEDAILSRVLCQSRTV